MFFKKWKKKKTGRNRKKQEEAGRNKKKREETGRNRKKRKYFPQIVLRKSSDSPQKVLR